MSLFSFIQSINTTLGTSVFEQVAVIIAAPHFKRAIHQYKEFNNTISENAQTAIQRIVDDLRAARMKPDKSAEKPWRVLAGITTYLSTAPTEESCFGRFRLLLRKPGH
jgi:hypothetical protein